MNKSYVIVPVVLLALFGFLYSGALKEMDAKEARLAAEKAKIAAADAQHKADVEARAAADALLQQQKREAEDKAKADKKERDYQDGMKKLKDEADDYAAQATRYAKEAADTEVQISATRTEKEKLDRDSLELSRQVELAKITRRNAELEIQRMVAMLGAKLSESSIALPPPPPPLPTK